MTQNNNDALSIDTSGKGPLFFSRTFEWLVNWLPGNGMSKHTVEAYRTALDMIMKYLNSQGISIGKFHFGDLNRDFFRAWMEWLQKEKGNSPVTINARLTALKAYMEYVASEDVTLQSIKLKVDSVPSIKTDKLAKTILSEQEILWLIEEVPEGKRGYRDRVMIGLLYETGCRISELLSLKVSSVNLSSENIPYIKVEGKGKKQRIIALSDDMAAVLKTYIELFHEGERNESYMFYTTHDGIPTQMKSRTFQTLLSKYAKTAAEKHQGFPDRVHPHMLRRTRATHLFRNGLAFEVVSGLLGHEQLETTRCYATPSIEQMRQAMSEGVIKGHEEEPEWKKKEEILARYFGLKNNAKKLNTNFSKNHK